MSPWNPTARPSVVTVPIPSSEGAATVDVQKWATRQHLDYQDDSIASMQIVSVETKDGEETQMRRVRPSALIHTYLRITIVGCTGFPPQDGAPFSFQNPDHVAALDYDVMEEVFDAATDVQPVPSSEKAAARKRPQDHKAKEKPLPPEATPETASDFDRGEDESDPSPTQP